MKFNMQHKLVVDFSNPASGTKLDVFTATLKRILSRILLCWKMLLCLLPHMELSQGHLETVCLNPAANCKMERKVNQNRLSPCRKIHLKMWFAIRWYTRSNYHASKNSLTSWFVAGLRKACISKWPETSYKLKGDSGRLVTWFFSDLNWWSLASLLILPIWSSSLYQLKSILDNLLCSKTQLPA